PAIGLAGAGLVALSEGEAALLRSLRLHHLRADLHLEGPGWEGAIERAAANARLLGVPLEVALFLPEDPRPGLRDLAARASALRLPVATWLVFRARDGVTDDALLPAARGALAGVAPEALFGGGSDSTFADLNRRRPGQRLDVLSVAVNPQVHAFDDATLVENVSSLPWLAETVSSFAGGTPLHLSPVTLRPRVDPRPATSREGPPFSDDPRQGTSFAAGWTLGFLASAAEARVRSVTFFELTGPRGVMEGGTAYPILDALADVAALSGAEVLPARSRRPERVQALALRSEGKARVFLANVTGEPHPVRVEGLAGPVIRAPLGVAAGASAEGPEVELAPHEVARLDVTVAAG
ncbi:MAG TPA: hypothetical protein VGB87_19765, partial [Vicinamibacteria bacterium]